MKNTPAPASSTKQMGKRKLKAVVEDVVVEDVVVEDELEDDPEDDGNEEGSSEDEDYEEEVEEDDPNEVLGAGDYVEEVEYLQPTQSGRKRKVVEKQEKVVPNTSNRSKPVQQQKRIYRTVKRPAAVKRQFVERPHRQYVERPSATQRQYVERPPPVQKQYVERPPPVQRQYVEMPGQVQRRRIVVEQDDEIDLEPGPSVGEKVKMNGVVVSTQLRKCGKSANNNCRISAFSYLITILNIDQEKIDLVTRCGFGGLMKLKVKKIDRRFCYWLMTRVDHDKSVLVGVDGKELPLGPEQWRCIFDLPRVPRPVPNMVEDPLIKSKVTDIVRHYGELNASGRENISIQKAYDCLGLMPIGTEEKKDNFMRVFLTVILGCILCPTTNGQSMCTSLLPDVTVEAGANEYDCCSCVHRRLMGYVRDFQKRFDPKGYAASGGGCALFLMIFYLDHLALPPLSWGTMPRIDVWADKKFTAAIQEDLLSSLDYGKLKLVDVAYGERHPLEPRDSVEPLEVRVGKECGIFELSYISVDLLLYVHTMSLWVCVFVCVVTSRVKSVNGDVFSVFPLITFFHLYVVVVVFVIFGCVVFVLIR
ncbi:uncharacterized protein LOC110738552 [Chenopodium quinoa]|uniref:uncharacterized protein LOC110738552 n=1 Tax=Chenopodium quinoa TaxID=63459 RepID=UPI000B79A882|nr:uncharacterized protein LOC110738552 [Chenopodium quinoa]